MRDPQSISCNCKAVWSALTHWGSFFHPLDTHTLLCLLCALMQVYLKAKAIGVCNVNILNIWRCFFWSDLAQLIQVWSENNMALWQVWSCGIILSTNNYCWCSNVFALQYKAFRNRCCHLSHLTGGATTARARVTLRPVCTLHTLSLQRMLSDCQVHSQFTVPTEP